MLVSIIMQTTVLYCLELQLMIIVLTTKAADFHILLLCLQNICFTSLNPKVPNLKEFHKQ